MNNNKHGKGTFIYEDGRQYIGHFHADKRHGYGIYHEQNGMKYEGEWDNDLQHGKGVVIDANGNCTNVKYNNGKLVNNEEPS